MKTEGYIEYLREQEVSDEAIEKQMALIADLIAFFDVDVPQSAAAVKAEVDRFARKLINEERNTLENFWALCRYANWLGQRDLYVALIEVTDCHNVLDVLGDEIEARHGREVCERIFAAPLPPLGADEEERSAYACNLMEYIAQELTPEEARAVLFPVQHGLSPAYWAESDAADREKFRKCADIDEFLDLKRRERDELLTRLHAADELWYTVEITDEVLEFAKNDPEMEVGQRVGDKIYITKIPYNAPRYLQETDPKVKRYYACHCPFLRQAILQDWPISPDVCACSLGFSSHGLVGLGQDLKGEVLESVARGDTRCRFVFYLPDNDDGAGG